MALRTWLRRVVNRACVLGAVGDGQLLLPSSEGTLESWWIDLAAGRGSSLRVDLKTWGTTVDLSIPYVEPPWEVETDELLFFGDGDLEAMAQRGEARIVALAPGARAKEKVASWTRTHTRWRASFRLLPPSSLAIPSLYRGSPLFVPSFGELRVASVDAIVSTLYMVAAAQVVEVGEANPEVLITAARLLVSASVYLPRDVTPEAVMASRRFRATEMMHAFIAMTLVADTTGRVAQMVDVCPGLLIVAKGLKDRGEEGASDELIVAITRGQKLGAILALAVEAWGRLQASSAKSFDVPTSRDRRVWRQMIRRAKTRVLPSMLVGRFIPGLVVDDIPDDEEDNARWFEIVSRAPDRSGGGVKKGARSEVLLRRFGAFLSKHWRDVEDFSILFADDLDRVSDSLFDFLHATRRVPGRATDPLRLLLDCILWHAPRDWAEEAKLPPETRLKIDGLKPWREGQAMITPLGTVGALADESRRMGHCVATYAPIAAAGEVHIFHVAHSGGALTVMTERRGRRLSIVEVAGVNNRPPNAEEEALLSRWVIAVNADLRYH